MTTLSSLTEALRRKADAFSPTEARLAAHLVEHPDAWGLQPTTDLATALGVHRSTIVRFAQRLGYAGYPELQRQVRDAYLRSVATPTDLTIIGADPVHDGLLQAVYEREQRNLHQTYAKLDAGAFEATALRLAEAREVLVFGRRFSYAIALHLAYTLRTMRPQVRLAPEPGGSSVDAVVDLGPDDVALVVSLRRHSTEVRRVLRLLVDRGVPTTLLTDASPVADLGGGVAVLQAHIGSATMLDSFTSLTSLAHALLALAAAHVPGADARLAAIEGIWSKLSDP